MLLFVLKKCILRSGDFMNFNKKIIKTVAIIFLATVAVMIFITLDSHKTEKVLSDYEGSYIIQKEVSNHLYTFDFEYVYPVLKNKEKYPQYNYGSGLYDVNLKVIEGESDVIQEFNFESFSELGITFFIDEITSQWKITDINFDGFEDIFCLYNIGGTHRTKMYKAWIFNSVSNQFESIDLTNINNIEVDADCEVLRTYTYDMCDIYEIYKYIDNEFILTNTLEVIPFITDFGDTELAEKFEDENVATYSESRLIDGEMTPISVVNNLRQEDREFIKTEYYSENSVWKLKEDFG